MTIRIDPLRLEYPDGHMPALVSHSVLHSKAGKGKTPWVLPAPTVLLALPESREAEDLKVCLRDNGYDVVQVKDGEAACNALNARPVNALVAHLNVHRIDGLRLLNVAKGHNPEICAILIADHADVELATEAMRRGAYDFQCRPLNLKKMLAVLRRGISHQQLTLKLADIQQRMDERYGFHQIVGRSAAMQQVYNTITQIAPAECTVLICGETGTGKELVAQAIHQNSARKNGPLVKLNCGALAESIVESEMFGHQRGAFTGAVNTRRGRFEIARGGTLFLDEVGEITPATQVKLLRVLETGEFERLGESRTRCSDVRVIAATNRDLLAMVRQGAYRRDLYHRLNVVTVTLPALRERKEDLPLLVGRFIEQFNREYDKRITGLTRCAMDALLRHDWPGNVRELKNCIEGMVAFAPPGGRLDLGDLPYELRQDAPPRAALPIHVGMTREEAEQILIRETLKATGYDKQKAARMLGIGLRTLYRKMKRYGIE